ncbi:stigma-specific STIG1-like protein 1 [Prosopis cineraria]|uniref:stigma-specific STIG1-like protein 1 n=1 Tax=Prosopis cineraria TaxID=364024 RepID=UPI00241096DD|nr:stigma-specific STIG1-like protein 1 [Prosopis cineraria]
MHRSKPQSFLSPSSAIEVFLPKLHSQKSKPSSHPPNMNKSLSLLFLFITIVAASAITVSKAEEKEFNFGRGLTGRFLAGITNCKINPKVCVAEGSAGPDCCYNKCVNLEMDSSNCGKCGKKCGHQKICCEGKCVNPMNNEKHCGKCGNKCGEDSSCLYGMCSYA